MKIAATCPNGHKLEALPGLAGCTLPCPACGESVVLPEFVDDKLPAKSNVAASQEPLTESSHSKATTKRRWLLLSPIRLATQVARGIGLTLLLFVGLWFFFVYRNDYSVASVKLQRIGWAFLAFHDTHRAFALPRVRDMEVLEVNRGVRPTELSWRVHLLPYLEQKPLYDQFHLDEPWDSPHNLALAEHMPEVYRLGGSHGTTTRFQILTGPDMLFGQKTPPRLRDVPDGSRSTIMVVTVGKDRATPWTKPDELVVDRDEPLGSLGQISDKYIATVTCDARLLMLPADIESSAFLALATPRGKEIIDGDTYRREFEETQWATIPSLMRWLTN